MNTPLYKPDARSKLPLPGAIIREIAVHASVDPTTVEKALRGLVPRGQAGHRVRAELTKRGLLHLAPGFDTALLGSVDAADK